VALRTAGAYPRRLAEVLPLVDWVGIDMKAAPTAYERVTGQGVAGARAWSSLELVMRSGVPYEVTITVDPRAHSREDVLGAAREVIRRGAHAPVLCGRRLYEVITHDDLPDLARR
jgi:pyruvate formate lyase activating enzyme